MWQIHAGSSGTWQLRWGAGRHHLLKAREEAGGMCQLVAEDVGTDLAPSLQLQLCRY